MSIRQGLLALLEERPRYGYELRQEFESRTGSTWPLNVGQVYTTLARLERDGLVEPDHTDDEGHVYYRITDDGRADVREWFARPVARENQRRDELAIKLALAITLPGVDVARDRPDAAHRDDALAAGSHPASRPASGDADLAWTLVADCPGLPGGGRDPLARPLRGTARTRSGRSASGASERSLSETADRSTGVSR